MRNEEEIKERILQLKAQLELLDKGLIRQRELPFFERSYRGCMYLNIEKERYAYTLEVLEWVLA